MKFTVVWLPWAEERLAEIWNEATDRTAVAGAADTIDRELRYDPTTKGSHVANSVRYLVVAPLVIFFQILPDDCVTRVLSVERTTRP